jgi:hypothetical protein
VTWQELNFSTGFDIYQQRYDATGSTVGGETLVSTTLGSNDNFMPSTTGLSDGGWVVTWSDTDYNTSAETIHQQRYDSHGNFVDGDVTVSTVASIVDNEAPSTTALSDGGWVVTWRGVDTANKSFNIYQQHYDLNGAPVGGEVTVNNLALTFSTVPSVTGVSDGWVVAWMNIDPGTGSQVIYQRHYDSAGNTSGGDVIVSATDEPQDSPSITALNGGGWIVTWYALNPATSTYDIYQQRYGTDSTALGDPVVVNTTTADRQFTPSVTALSDGWLVSWQGINGSGDFDIYQRRFTIEPNQAPTGPATGTLTHGTEDVAHTVTAAELLTGFSDADDPTSSLVVTGLSIVGGHATVSGDAKSGFFVTPDPNFNGDVTLSYTVSDGNGGDTPVTRTLTFDPVNDAPTGPLTGNLLPDATEDIAHTVTSADLLAGFSDVDDATANLSVTNVSITGGHATLSGDAKSGFLVTPNKDFNGNVTLSYTVTDGHGGDTAVITRTLTFDPVNDAPTGPLTGVLLPDGTEDNARAVTAADLLAGFTDVDDETANLTVTGVSITGGHATLSGDATSGFTVTPDKDFNGDVTLTYTVTDGHGGNTAVITRTLTFDPVNDAPVGDLTGVILPDGTEDNVSTVTAATLLTGFTDVDDDTASLTVTDVSITGGKATLGGDAKAGFTVTPDKDFNGDVTLKYTVTDGHGGDITVTRTLTFDPVNDAPVGDLTGALPHGTEDTVSTVTAATLLAGFTDVDDETASLTVTDVKINGGHATLGGDAATGFTVTPDKDFNGNVTLTYTVTDGHGGNTDVTRTLTFDPANDAPELIIPPANQDADEGTLFNFALPAGTFTDIDEGDVLSYKATLANGNPLPSWLTFDPETQTFSGTPAHADVGTIEVTVVATDTSEASASGTFDITVAGAGGGLGDIVLSNNSVKENSDGGTLVGKLSVPDADPAATLTYTLLHNPHDAFKIVGNKLVVADGADLDFETKKHFKISVDASGSDGSDFVQKFVIDITDVKETPKGTPKDDVLIGDAFDNDFHGRAGSDHIKGMGGDDVIRSDLGDDFLTGGSGADTFYLARHAGHDVLTDFNPGEGDRINLALADGIKDFDDLMAHHVETQGNGVLITADDGSTMFLRHVSLHDLKENEFIF